MTSCAIAMFTHSRPHWANRALAALAACDHFAECRTYVFCDGPRGDADATAVSQNLRVVREWAGQTGATVVASESNRGLAQQIVSGVTQVLDRHERVIVLEDDLLIAPSFLSFMLQALERYEDSESVMQVAGFSEVAGRKPPAASFVSTTSTWGWGTWRRAWARFRVPSRAEVAALGADPDWSWRFDVGGSYPYCEMLWDRLDDRNQSWGIMWYFSVFAERGKVIRATPSLVWVGGFDATGENCGAAQIPQRRLCDVLDDHGGASRVWPENTTVRDSDMMSVQEWNRSLLEATSGSADRRPLWRRIRSRATRWYRSARRAASGAAP